MMHRSLLALLALAVLGTQAFVPQCTRGHTGTVAFGKGDKRTRKGKIINGSSGKARPKLKKRKGPVDPYFTLREWGKLQDPPMTVEEVIDMKIKQRIKKTLTPEELLQTVTPF
ncbi:hypothetical protein CTAYLR_008584 [Chrysophaeum taylorii]|uniref:Uncharacterized protein n=1 Tax=Chrysophaeum taylorii TaxID=2483200 RepID=A0AAD7UFJ1_9STRA|nr:hypothetical protein CTAYLR_008584 [Chrysophaeum taylorii]